MLSQKLKDLQTEWTKRANFAGTASDARMAYSKVAKEAQSLLEAEKGEIEAWGAGAAGHLCD